MDELRQDLRYAFRTLRKQPLFATVAVITLALGIGANTAVFSVVSGVLWRPLPYDDPEQLAVVWTDFGVDLPQNWISGPEFVEIQEFNTTLESFAIVAPFTASFTGFGEPEQIQAAAASGEIFRVLRTSAVEGRLFGPEDDTPGAERVAVLSDGFWQRRFGGDASAVGQTITLDANSYVVIGVLPPEFRVHHPDAGFASQVEVWAPGEPLLGQPYSEMNRGSHFLRGFARLADGVTLEQARADGHAVAARIQEKSPDYYDFEGWDITVLSLHADVVEDVKSALLVLLGAVVFVLLIACVNVANLQLSRAAAREREIAVRTALGAGRGRLARLLLTEGVVLAAAGAVMGLLLAFWLVRTVVALAPASLPLKDAISVNGAVLVFTAFVALFAGIIFGFAPVVYSRKLSLTASLKEGGRGTTRGVGGRRVRTGLVVAEVALALVLLIGAGLMVRSVAQLLEADPGFDSQGVLTMRVSLPAARYDTDGQRSFFDQLISRVSALPGVSVAGAVSQLPLSGAYSSGTTVARSSDVVPLQHDFDFPFIEADRRVVTPGYFEAMRAELVAGRVFDEHDRADGLPVAIVDDEFQRRFWPGETAVGQQVAVGFGDGGPAWREVVGVVRQLRHYDLGSAGREAIYTPHAQNPATTMYLTVRTTTEPTGLASQVRGEVWALDPQQPVSEIRTMERRVSQAVAQPRFNLWLLVGFAGLALVLATVGIYGVIAQSVGQREHEIGIRMALGADRDAVRRMVLRQGMTLVGFGLTIGVVTAIALTRTLSGMLYGVSATDPLTYVGVAILLSAVAVVACLIPAVRATRVHPVAVLKDE